MAGPGIARSPRGRAAIAVLAIAALLVALVVASGLVAEAASRRSFDPGRALEQRLTDARTAMRLAPWSASYATREFVLATWLSGSRLLDAGDYSGAADALRTAYRRAVGDRELLALFQRAQEIEAMATNRKAHLQHGHEGPGSTLRPQDVER